MPKVRVSAVCLRGGNNETPLPPVLLRLVTDTITVRELIERSVAKQVESLASEISSNTAAEAERFELQYLNEAELFCRRMLGLNRSVEIFDAEQAIAQALDGFRQHAFKVLVDGKVHTELEERLLITEGASVSFLRVVPSLVH